MPTTMRSCFVSTACCVLFVCAVSVQAESATKYIVTDLGDLSGGSSTSIATSINSYGQVTGLASENNAFLWTPTSPNATTGAMQSLGDLNDGAGHSHGQSINAFGQVAAWSTVTNSGDTGAMLWTPSQPNGGNGSITNIGTLPGWPAASALGINAMGQVAGESGGGPFDRAFLWTPFSSNGNSGTMTQIVASEGEVLQSVALAINSPGQVIGYTDNRDGHYHAFLWSPTALNGDSGNRIDLYDPLAEIRPVIARAIADDGTVVGDAIVGTSNTIHAYAFKPTLANGSIGQLVDFGDLPGGSDLSAAYAINALGQAVGYSSTAGGTHAFIWTQSDQMIDLNTLIEAADGWTLQEAYGINDAGQIVGRGWHFPSSGNPTQHAYLLTPVPEPTLLFAAFVCMFILRRRNPPHLSIGGESAEIRPGSNART